MSICLRDIGEGLESAQGEYQEIDSRQAVASIVLLAMNPPPGMRTADNLRRPRAAADVADLRIA